MAQAKNTIAVACDHAGAEMKNAIIAFLIERGYDVIDRGCDGSCSVDYPLFARMVCEDLQQKNAFRGILICGTGIGMSIAANKHRGIRAALCDRPFLAEMARRHNDANVLCLGARVISVQTAIELTDIFLATPFDKGRHEARIAMLDALDEGLPL